MTLFLKLIKNLIFLPNFINLMLILLSFVYLALRFPLLPPQIPLWHTLPWGKDQLSSPVFLWSIPLGMLTIYILNLSLGISIFKSGSFLTSLISWQGLLVTLLGLVALWKVVVLSIP